jgi:predicted RNA-binding Zn ribbon-like protein
LLALLLDGEGDPEHVVAHGLDKLAAGIPLRMRVGAGGRVELEPAMRGPLAVAGRALILAHDAAVDGTWERISLCRADDCHWAFVDRSKNHSRVWCSMTDCGARAKARAYRERQRRP